MMHFIPPWGGVARVPAELIERHSARARALDMLDTASPKAVLDQLNQVDDETRLKALAAADKAVDLLRAMVAWNPPDYTPPDMPALRVRLLGEGFSHACLWGGRGGGKSHLIADVIVELASVGKERVVCAREFMVSTSESVRDLLVEKIKASRWANEWTCLDTELRNDATGSKITFLGLARNPTAQKSMAGVTIVWVEEASDVSQGSIDLMVPTVMREASSRIFWTYNPTDEDTPVDVMFRQGDTPERSIVQGVQSDDNPWFYVGKMAGERRTSYNKHTSEKFRNIWRGAVDVTSESLIYHDWSIGRVDVGDATPIYGLDWGYVDPFACLEIFVIEPEDPEAEKGIIYISAEAYGSHIPAKQIPDKIDERMPLARNHTITADSSEPKSIEDLNTEGFHVIPAKKGPGSIRAGISFIQGYRIVVAPDCVNVQSELGSYRWKTNKVGTVLRDPVDLNNHAMDGMRYGLEDYEPARDGGVSYA